MDNAKADADETCGAVDGGGRGRRHLMSSVCIDVRPARLVQSAAAPSEPMPFELRESREREDRGFRGKYRPGEVDVII